MVQTGQFYTEKIGFGSWSSGPGAGGRADYRVSTEKVSMLRKHIQRSVRAVHRSFFRRPLPKKLGLYLHSTAGCEKQLDELLCFLRERGYVFTGPDEFLTSGGNSCFLSFDDNYRSWLGTLRIFERYQASATFYVNTWPFRNQVSEADVRHYIYSCRLTNVASEQETTLSTVELREIAGAGHIIGAHTHTHPVLTALPLHSAREEIRICREELASHLGRAPEHFAYPFGMRRHFSRSLRSYCRSIGFRTIANAIPCMQYAPSRPDSLHRSVWLLEQPLAYNLENVCIDGRLFSSLTGRSAVGGSFG
jgi:peptidoglycan/xylan/chitin deacetylase (PgdA/CDA1 family)